MMGGIVQTFKENGDRAMLDPRTFLFGILVISAVMIGGKLTGVEYWLRLICCIIPFGCLMALRKWRFAVFYFLLFAYAMVIEGAVVELAEGVINLILIITTGIISRFLAQTVLAYCFMQSVTVSEFVTSMERMHVPQVITIPLSVMFRFFPTISEENRNILEAMRMRQIDGSRQGLFKRLEYELVPVMMSTVRIADELSQAAMTKGLGGKVRRTHVCVVGLRIRDIFLLILLTVILVLFVVF